MIKRLIILTVLVAVAAGAYLIYRVRMAESSWEKCVARGGAILESYPAQCLDPYNHKTYPDPSAAVDF